eukprot:IDg18545t1
MSSCSGNQMARPWSTAARRGKPAYCLHENSVEKAFQKVRTNIRICYGRLGENDLGANRKRIRNIRVALQEKGGWASEGY